MKNKYVNKRGEVKHEYGIALLAALIALLPTFILIFIFITNHDG